MKRYRTSPEEPKEECLHQNSLWGMCVLCGQPIIVVPDESETETDTNVKKRAKTLEKQAKLSLVLDLDNTLLNSTLLSGLTKSEAASLKSRAESPDKENPNPSGLFMSEEKQMMTKLRPFVRTFLEEVSRLFDLYIFTMGTFDYAADMVSLLDPESRYFDKTRVFSRDNVSYRKGLSIVPVVRSACVIIDNMGSVWPDDRYNVIEIDKYNYFASSSCDCKSLSELNTDEPEISGALAKILKVLRRVHATYFADNNKDDHDSDVREILKTIRKDILGGCKVLFCSCVDEEDNPAYAMDLEMKAAALGATWAACVDQTVTHVVAVDPASEEAVWAAKEGKFLVNPKWIETAHYLWERPNENMYPVTWW